MLRDTLHKKRRAEYNLVFAQQSIHARSTGKRHTNFRVEGIKSAAVSILSLSLTGQGRQRGLGMVRRLEARYIARRGSGQVSRIERYELEATMKSVSVCAPQLRSDTRSCFSPFILRDTAIFTYRLCVDLVLYQPGVFLFNLREHLRKKNRIYRKLFIILVKSGLK